MDRNLSLYERLGSAKSRQRSPLKSDISCILSDLSKSLDIASEMPTESKPSNQVTCHFGAPSTTNKPLACDQNSASEELDIPSEFDS